MIVDTLAGIKYFVAANLALPYIALLYRLIVLPARRIHATMVL